MEHKKSSCEIWVFLRWEKNTEVTFQVQSLPWQLLSIILPWYEGFYVETLVIDLSGSLN